MRGRILLKSVVVLTAVAMLAGCGKPDSLYIEPGQRDAPKKVEPAPKGPEKTPATKNRSPNS